jgi:hypothetical protein
MKATPTMPALIKATLPMERIARCIYLARGEKVMLDRDLAELYGVETRVLNQAVRRNLIRFPDDFLFKLSRDKIRALAGLREDTEFKHSKAAFAFTEQGVAMLSSVLRSDRAVQVNIAVMRAFVQLRQMLASHADLARKFKALEKKYDGQFKIVFDAIHQLMERPDPLQPDHGRQIGFHAAMPANANGVNKPTKKKRLS